jgi:dTDP-4-amino-4,6-dideoxygalactose transaminase
VIIPSFTFVATAHALQWQEITPVFCDIDPITHTIDPALVERMITPRTTGIIGVHVWGNACNIEALEEIARRRNLKLLFDAAHAFSGSYNGRMIGNFGNAEVFSFHATKFFNTFEGGAVVTNDDELAAKIRLMKNFGFAGYDNVIYIGTNGKMSEVCGAKGLASFESIEEFIATNRRNYQHYMRELSRIPGIRFMEYGDEERKNYQYIVCEVDETETGISRDVLISILWKENVIARKYFYPGCHRMEPYRSYYPHAGLMLETTEEVAAKVLLLPNGTAVREEEIAEICSVIRIAIERSEEATARIAAINNPEAEMVMAGAH